MLSTFFKHIIFYEKTFTFFVNGYMYSYGAKGQVALMIYNKYHFATKNYAIDLCIGSRKI